MVSKIIAIRGSDFVIMGNEIVDQYMIPSIYENPICELQALKCIIAIYAEEVIRKEFLTYLDKILRKFMMQREQPLVLDELRQITFQAVEAFACQENAIHLPVWLAGFDVAQNRPNLFAFDGYGGCISSRYVCYGKGLAFVRNTMDYFWRPQISLKESLQLVSKMAERASSVGYLHTFACTVVDRNNIRQLSPIHPFDTW